MTDLHLRVVADGSATDVVVAVEPTHTVGELAAALDAHVRRPPGSSLVRNGHELDAATPVGCTGLVRGDLVELVAGRDAPDVPDPSPHSSVATGPRIAIDVVGGPDAGRSFVVTAPGRHTIGRGADVRIGDPTVSRHHATVELDRTGRAMIVPGARPANGVVVGDLEVVGPTPVGPTDVVMLGATRLAVRPVPDLPDDSEHHAGTIDVQRTPYRPPVVQVRSAEPFGPVPDRPEPRRVPLVGVLAPLVAGVAMYALSRQLQFLALTLVSPIVVVGSAWEDRRSGRRAARARVATFRDALVVRRQELATWRDDERVERFAAAPDLADLVRRAELRSIDLWPRGRDAPDFLQLRLGLGDDSVRFPIELAPGGDDDLRADAAAAFAGLDRLDGVPVLVDLADDPVFAVHGPALVVDGVVASMLVQAATLHSPDDLVVAAAVSPDRPFGWIRWLPHARSVASPLSGDHVAVTSEAADALVARLLDVADARTAGTAPSWPRVLLLLDVGLPDDAAGVAQLLDVLPDTGVAVVCIAAAASAVPRQATTTFALRSSPSGASRGHLWSTDPTVADRSVEAEHLRPALADRLARRLAPLRDASSGSLASTIPRTVPLLDVLGVGRPSPSWVVEHWERRPLHGLRVPIGVGPAGPVEIDLVEDGPHALVGGTSGSGKSELLQSMVAALAVRHPPNRLNFLFVDYKGGAFARAFDRLPHAVGSVSNLTPELAARALTSLRAELHRRMAVLDGRAKDLAELLSVAPDDAPASLVIVVDEFATLVREIPGFVDGVVDLAQRGRSLGIHLILATQRPSGSVNEHILANTNIRIALRMLDRSESMAIVGTPDAADVPVPLRGRGVVRVGPRRVVELQAAYGGAPLRAEQVRPPVLVVPFDATDASPRSGGRTAVDGRTQLDAILDAVAEAARRVGLPPAHRPWRDVLPDVVVLDDVLASVEPAQLVDTGRLVTIGLLDAPERQEQRPAVVDLEDGGGLLVFGSGGAGASTLLRTVAASVNGPDGSAVVVAFDPSGRGLAGLAALPHVAGVASGDDPEAVTRYLLLLEAELVRRRRLLAESGAEHVSSIVSEQGVPVPRVVVLVDGLGTLTATLADDRPVVGDEWSERLVRIVVEGRQVGIHAVIAADRRAAVPARIHAAIGHRLLLRQADEASALDHGVSPERLRGVPPGRGLWNGSLVQVASVSADPDAQRVALVERGRRVLPAPAIVELCSVLTGSALPDRVTVDPSAAGCRSGHALGVADLTGHPVAVEVLRSVFTVCGPPRSGRSTALAALAAGAGADTDVVLLHPTRRVDVVDELEQALHRRWVDGDPSPRLVVIDDADTVDDPRLDAVVARLVRVGVGVVLAVETRSMSGYTTNPLVALGRRSRRLLVLQPDDPAEFLQTTGVRLVVRPGLTFPPGRGVLLVDRRPTVVQVVDPDDHPPR